MKILTKEKKVIDVVQVEDAMSYIKGGEITTDSQMPSIMVESGSDLDLLANYPPGTIAFTAGYANIWQKTSANEWVTV